MIKLRIVENDNEKWIPIYISLIPYTETISDLSEEVLSDDDVVKQWRDYTNVIETRESLADHLESLANRLKNQYDFVIDADVRPASDKTKRGLSVYIDIVFKHPEEISNNKIKAGYTYSLRFSDHEPNDVNNLVAYVDVKGRKVKNLEKFGAKEFINKIDTIQEKISEYEVETFGRALTELR